MEDCLSFVFSLVCVPHYDLPVRQRITPRTLLLRNIIKILTLCQKGNCIGLHIGHWRSLETATGRSGSTPKIVEWLFLKVIPYKRKHTGTRKYEHVFVPSDICLSFLFVTTLAITVPQRLCTLVGRSLYCRSIWLGEELMTLSLVLNCCPFRGFCRPFLFNYFTLKHYLCANAFTF